MLITGRVKDWHEIIVSPEDTFATTLERMGNGGYQLALVCNSSRILVGLVTDSDVRKALLKGITLDHSVTAVMNRAPLIASDSLGNREASQLMLLNRYFHLPVVDSEGRLTGLHVAEQLRTSPLKDEAFVIMAGGRGARLMPLTSNTPKPMLPLNGKPILEHIIQRAQVEGFHQFVVSVNYLSDRIVEYFGDGSSFGVKIEYIHETKPLGTAGSLASLPSHLKSRPIVVTNADILTDVAYANLLQVVSTDHADGAMAVRIQEHQNPFGVVHSSGSRISDIEEKPIYRYQINAGMYALSPTLVSLLLKDEYCDMPDLFLLGIEKGLDLRVFPLHEAWIDIGRPCDYQEAGMDGCIL